MSRLGKGLGAIFNENTYITEEAQPNEKIVEIEIEKLKENPYQPRRIFDETKIEELAQSIKEHGVFQPIIVKKSEAGFYIVAGERRFRACKKLGLLKIPAIVRDIDDKTMAEIALLENLQRENLTIIEEANAYNMLIEKYSYTQQEVADRVGKSRSHITNSLRLLNLPDKVQGYLSEGKIDFGHAKILAGLDNDSLINTYAEKIITENLSVRSLEQLLKDESDAEKEALKPVKEAIKKEEVRDVQLDFLEDQLISKLGTAVKIVTKEGKGKLVVEFSNTLDLNRILEIMQFNFNIE